MCVSPSGDALSFVDNLGKVHLWGRTADNISFVEYPVPVEFPSSVEDTLPSLTLDDPDTPLSSVGMPYYSSELLSAWPANLAYETGLPPQRFNEKLLTGMTAVRGYLVGPWHSNGNRRYQVQKSDSTVELPRFRSEKERALAGGIEQEQVVGRFEGGEHGVPNYYKQVEIKYSKFGVEDFDFGYPPSLKNQLT
jgi:PAB-dependent poly(A)-specific ribonuclease subunit 2